MAGLTKTEGGISYPARCFLDVPDPKKPSTWGLRICELVEGEIKITKSQLGRAAAALSSKGYRGNQYKTRSAGKSHEQLVASLVSKYRSLGVSDEDIPSYLLPASHMAHSRRGKKKETPMDKFISHYGIKGMKWGIRKDYRTSGQKLTAKAKSMSEEQLRSSIKRMQLERQYADLVAKENTANRTRRSRGREKVGKIMGDAGSEVAKSIVTNAEKGGIKLGAAVIGSKYPTVGTILNVLQIDRI